MDRFCTQCGAMISRTYPCGNRVPNYDTRIHCSMPCQILARTHVLSRNCQNCGEVFTRNRYNGVLESKHSFDIRKYCSNKCRNTAQIKHFNETKRQEYRQFLGQYCEACHGTSKLTGHHIDHDRTNNTAINIQTLCQHCHGFWHGLQIRIGAKIIGRMPVLLHSEPPIV